MLLRSLVSLYKPSYIFCNNKKINKTESVIKNSNNKEASKFNKNISFEQFKEFLKKYAETNPYPNIDE